MDTAQEELRFLGFLDIFKQSFKIIFKWRKIFSQITLAFVLPLSFIFLAHMQISQILFYKIFKNQRTLEYQTQVGTPSYNKLSHLVSSQWTDFWLFKAAYFTFLLILSLLSTSAVVYTIACIYTAKEITFNKVMSVIPKAWKRLMVTFIWNYAIVFVFNIVAAVLLFLIIRFIHSLAPAIVLLIVLVIFYLAGLVYITIVWHLASVVSVLEDDYGFKAMIKSKALIKGKMGVSVVIFFLLTICFIGIALLYENIVVLGLLPNRGIRIGIGILCLLLLIKVIVIGLVIQTVIYFVCKSYHHENIDKSSLADHLEVYLGVYVPLKAMDIQLEQFHV